jgi:hypothetical protein
MRRIALVLVSALALAWYGCAAEIPQLTPGAQRLRTGKSDPDPSMRELGQIEAVNGSGCGGFGTRGTYEGALNELKNRGAAMHADYVEIFTVTEPHAAPNCFVNEFIIRGTAYKAATAARVSAPAGGATPPAVQETAQKTAAGCDPPCSPGFACKNAVCEPVCNPPCEKGETCTRKRICEPTPTGI